MWPKQAGGSADWVPVSSRGEYIAHMKPAWATFHLGLVPLEPVSGPEECSVTGKGVISNLGHVESAAPDRLRHRWDPSGDSKMFLSSKPGPVMNSSEYTFQGLVHGYSALLASWKRSSHIYLSFLFTWVETPDSLIPRDVTPPPP